MMDICMHVSLTPSSLSVPLSLYVDLVMNVAEGYVYVCEHVCNLVTYQD